MPSAPDARIHFVDLTSSAVTANEFDLVLYDTIEAARLETERLAAERQARIEAKMAAEKAEQEALQAALDARIEAAKATLEHFTIGQRVRTLDGRVGTVANIKLHSATQGSGPGMLLKLGDSEGAGTAFVGPHEVAAFDHGQPNAAALPKARAQRLDRRWGRRPLDGNIGALPAAARRRPHEIRPSQPKLSYVAVAAEGSYYNGAAEPEPDAASGSFASSFGLMAVLQPSLSNLSASFGSHPALYSPVRGSRSGHQRARVRRSLSPLRRLAAASEPSLHDASHGQSSTTLEHILSRYT